MISTNVLEKFKLKRQWLLIRTDLWKHKKKGKKSAEKGKEKEPSKQEKGNDKSLWKKEPC